MWRSCIYNTQKKSMSVIYFCLTVLKRSEESLRISSSFTCSLIWKRIWFFLLSMYVFVLFIFVLLAQFSFFCICASIPWIRRDRKRPRKKRKSAGKPSTQYHLLILCWFHRKYQIEWNPIILTHNIWTCILCTANSIPRLMMCAYTIFVWEWFNERKL